MTGSSRREAGYWRRLGPNRYASRTTRMAIRLTRAVSAKNMAYLDASNMLNDHEGGPATL